jgi:hypothetical protein
MDLRTANRCVPIQYKCSEDEMKVWNITLYMYCEITLASSVKDTYVPESAKFSEWSDRG